MDQITRWLARCLLIFFSMLAFYFVLLIVSMTTPNVSQSDGFVGRTPDAISRTVSGTLPSAAKEIRYCRVSVGMGGRLLIYRLSAPADQLHAHALDEFENHWLKPNPKIEQNALSPFVEYDRMWRSAYGVEVDWMVSPPGIRGTLYSPADGNSSHQPLIFIDDVNSVLYFQMTD